LCIREGHDRWVHQLDNKLLRRPSAACGLLAICRLIALHLSQICISQATVAQQPLQAHCGLANSLPARHIIALEFELQEADVDVKASRQCVIKRR
jgi:hypothetical protein